MDDHEVEAPTAASQHASPGPALTLERCDALPGAGFHLFKARIEWADAAPAEGWGRGRDARTARIKALAEAVERSAYQRLPGSALEARGPDLGTFIAPTELVRYAPWQYGQPGFPFRPFCADETRWWLPATAQSGGSRSWVPADCVCNPRAFDGPYRRRLLTYATSSGCASASTMEDALLRAVLELVERDAFMRHWFAQAPGLALDTASLPRWAEVRLRRLHGAGCEAGVQCLTAGAQPTWLAWAQHPQAHFTCIGAACGLEPEPALASALEELETSALARIEGVPAHAIEPGQVHSPADHAALYATRAHFRAADRLLMAPASLDFSDAAESFTRDACVLFEKLRLAGHPVHCVDLSLPQADALLDGEPIRTVRAIAPGLIPLAFGQAQQPFGMADVLAAGGRNIHPFS